MGVPDLEMHTARWRTIVLAATFVLVLTFVFEAVKTTIWPNLTMWESHYLTILYSTVVGSVATGLALAQRWSR